MTAMLRGMAFGLLAAAAVGCAPAVVLENPAEWPEEYAKRRLHNTPNAFIYAGSDGAAGEADRLVIAVAKDFETMTGRKAKKGLVFVTDKNDEPLVRNLKKLIDLEIRKGALKKRAGKKAKKKPPTQRTANGDAEPPKKPKKSAEPKTPDDAVKSEKSRKPKKPQKPKDPAKEWDDAQKKMDELGVGVDVVLKAMPLPIPQEMASGFLGLPKEMTAQSDWIVTMPTKALVRDLVHTMIFTGLAKSDAGPMMKALVGVLSGPLCRSFSDALALMRDVVLFSIWTEQQSDWSEAEKQKKIAAYVGKRQRETLGPAVEGMLAGFAQGVGGKGKAAAKPQPEQTKAEEAKEEAPAPATEKKAPERK